jgi:hypothetical protein
LAAPLALDTDRLASLFRKVAAIQNDDTLEIAQVFLNLLPVLLQNLFIGPRSLTDELLGRTNRIRIVACHV